MEVMKSYQLDFHHPMNNYFVFYWMAWNLNYSTKIEIIVWYNSNMVTGQCYLNSWRLSSGQTMILFHLGNLAWEAYLIVGGAVVANHSYDVLPSSTTLQWHIIVLLNMGLHWCKCCCCCCLCRVCLWKRQGSMNLPYSISQNSSQLQTDWGLSGVCCSLPRRMLSRSLPLHHNSLSLTLFQPTLFVLFVEKK